MAAGKITFFWALCFPLKISFNNIERTELSCHLFQIEDMCGTTKAAAVPVIPDSEGKLCFHYFTPFHCLEFIYFTPQGTPKCI